MKCKGNLKSKRTKGLLLVFSLIPLIFSSCTKGFDGRDGRAYLALSYTVDEPEFVDAGTASVPEYFYWDEYYRSAPGFYTMYYDGFYDDGISITEYAWEVDYEIYVYEGEPGGIGYNGADAPDTYFSVECNPYGPYVYDENAKASLPLGTELLEKKKDKIVISKQSNGFGLRLTYRKVKPRED